MKSVQELEDKAHATLQAQGHADMLDAPDKIEFINEINRLWGEARRAGDTDDLPYIAAYRAGAYDIHRAISTSHSIMSDGSKPTSAGYTLKQIQAHIDKDVKYARYGTEIPTTEQVAAAEAHARETHDKSACHPAVTSNA